MVKNTFVVKFGGYFGFGGTLEEAMAEFVKAGGSKKQLQKDTSNRAIVRVDHDENVQLFMGECGISTMVNGHTAEEMTDTERALACTTKYFYLTKTDLMTYWRQG